MIGSLLLLAMKPLAGEAPPPQLELSAEDRRALLIGIRRRVGGAFVLTGLKDGQAACDAERVCVTGNALVDRGRSNPAIASIGSVSELVARTRVYGQNPAAVVSVRGAARGRRDNRNIEVRVSVYDTATGEWSRKNAVISDLNGLPSPIGGGTAVRVLLAWNDA